MSKLICKGMNIKEIPKEQAVPEGWKKTTEEDFNNQALVTIEKQAIKKWFNDNDYIELQALRGTIEKTSQKYINYINEYNHRLARLHELENK